MISSIQLRNFRSHIDSIVNFSSGTNILIGPSRAGKSQILLAIGWVATGKPKGNFHVPRGDKKAITEVDITFSTGEMVTRRRSANGKVNEYILSTYPDPFKTPGVGVPGPVEKLFNMSETNIQTQMGGLFMLSWGPTRISDYINELINLSAIDQVLDSLQSKQRTENSKVKAAETSIEINTKKLVNYTGLEELKNEIEAASALEEEKSQAEKTAIKAESSYRRLIYIAEQVERSACGLDLQPMCVSASTAIQKTQLLQAEVKHTSFLLSSLQTQQERVNRYGAYLNIQDLDHVRSRVYKVKAVQEKSQHASSLLSSLQIVQQQTDRTSKYLDLKARLPEIVTAIYTARNKQKTIADLSELIKTCRKNKNAITTFQELQPVCDQIDTAVGAIDRVGALDKQLIVIAAVILKLKEAAKKLQLIDIELQKAKAELAEIQPDICPLCNGEGKLK